jgi:hypothetical protein
MQVWAQSRVGKRKETCAVVQKWALYHLFWVDGGSEGRVTEWGGIALPQASHH